MKLLHLISILSFSLLVYGQPPKQQGGTDDESLNPIDPGDDEFNERLGRKCKSPLDVYRSVEGFCNHRRGLSKLWGSTNRPHFSYFNKGNTRPTGRSLPSARDVSNLLCKQNSSVFDERGVAEIGTFFGQFVDHTIVATPTNFEEPFDISIPAGDDDTPGEFGAHLPFKRSMRVRVKAGSRLERAQNSLSSYVDLTNVYGPGKKRTNFLRNGTDGLMDTGDGNLLPVNKRFNNAPRIGPQFFLAGDHRANEHPALTALHTLFLREHNRIAVVLKDLNPSWNDELLFRNAKRINEVQFQKIVFEEWYPAFTGANLPKYKGYQRGVDPTISLTFSTAAFRVGHTLVGNQVNRKGPNNSPLPPFPLTQMFFNTRKTIEANGIEPFLRGAIQSRAQKVDLLVTDALRNHLFKGIDGESDNFDLVALNIQRSRDHAIPLFTKIQQRFGIPKAKSFRQISKDRSVQEKLRAVYKTPGKVEAWPGFVAEDHERRKSFGKTLLKIWETEFARLRNGDRFYFRAAGALDPSIVRSFPGLQAMMDPNNNVDVFRRIILDNTDIKDSELPPRLFLVDPADYTDL